MQVYASILKVVESFGRNYISKDRRNSHQNYQYRGIEDVLLALNPLLVAHKLVVLPRVQSRETIIGVTKRGEPQVNTRLVVEYDIVSTEDGSKHTVSAVGEASDTSDKSHNKAMSMAYKYMAFMTFCIPTEGAHNDTEEYSPEVAMDPNSDEALKITCREWVEVINATYQIDLQPVKTLKLCQSKTGSEALPDVAKYLADLYTRLGSGSLTDDERRLLNL